MKAKQLLEQIRLEELQAGVVHNLRSLDAALKPTETPTEALGEAATKELVEARMDRLVDTTVAIDDALTTLFEYDDVSVQKRAIEAYIRRLYQVRGRCRKPDSYLSVCHFHGVFFSLKHCPGMMLAA